MHILLSAIKSHFGVCIDTSVKDHLYQAARSGAEQNRELVSAVHANNPLFCISSICFTGTLGWLLRISNTLSESIGALQRKTVFVGAWQIPAEP